MSDISLHGKTILQIIPHLNSGGAERTTIDVSDAIVASGARALVASQGGRLVDELKKRGVNFIHFAAASKNPFVIMMNAKKLKKLCQDEGVDLIHVRSRAPAWSSFIAARYSNIPLVTTVHGNYRGGTFLKRLYNSIMMRGDIIIANSARTALWIRKNYSNFSSKIEVIPRGVDLREFSINSVCQSRQEELRQSWGIGKENKIILLAARITQNKGHLIAIDAFIDIYKNENKKNVLVFVGDFNTKDSFLIDLNRKIISLGLQDYIHIVGHCADMPAAYAIADCVIAPSIAAEGFGRSLIEGQAMGRPVIASDLGTIPGVILSKEDVGVEQFTGWIVPSQNVDALSRAIREVLNLTEPMRRELGQRARNHVELNYSLTSMTQKTLCVYKRLLSN